jgi:uncharacterized membrane protein
VRNGDLKGLFMVPLIVLIASVLLFWVVGKVGVAFFQDFGHVLRAALAVMFVVTASAHWGNRRPDLIRMVPMAFPRRDLLVTITGVLELLGVVGLLLPMTARAACICLTLLLLALFPANIRAARERMTIAGQPVPSLPVRGVIQLVFVGTLIAAAWLR